MLRLPRMDSIVVSNLLAPVILRISPALYSDGSRPVNVPLRHLALLVPKLSSACLQGSFDSFPANDFSTL